MTHDRDPFDGPSPTGPLGEAMARLTDDAPPAGFSEATVRGEIDTVRSVRRQVFGGIAAAAAAITVLVVFVSSLGGGGSDTTSSASMSASASSSATGSSSAASSSAASSSASGGALSTSGAASGGETRGTPDKAPAAANGSTGDAAAESDGCRSAPLGEAQLQAVERVIGGLTRLDDCAGADDLGVQRYAVPGGSVLVERRAGGYDPCVDGAVCTEVAGRPGIRSADADGVTRVWTSGRDGAVVITADPAGTVDVDTLAAAAEALVAAGG